MKTTKKVKSAKERCDINFSKLKNRSVEVYVGAEKQQGVEIIGSRGKYAINADTSNERIAGLRGKSGTLKEVKKYVANHLCAMVSEPAKSATPTAPMETKAQDSSVTTPTISTESTTQDFSDSTSSNS